VIQVPEQFAAGLHHREGAAGTGWLARLPSLVAELCQRWHLLVDGPPMHGHLAIVVPVRRGEEAAALKVSWLDESTVNEARALSLWDGRGTVRLLEAARATAPCCSNGWTHGERSTTCPSIEPSRPPAS
jgi:streptomycin 6-kinase